MISLAVKAGIGAGTGKSLGNYQQDVASVIERGYHVASKDKEGESKSLQERKRSGGRVSFSISELS